MAKSININHSDASVLTNDGTFLQLSKNGAVKVGYGKNLEESTINNYSQATLTDYEGAIRINQTTKKLEYCNGTVWIEFLTETDSDEALTVYSLIF